jgi:hypothetical protein
MPAPANDNLANAQDISGTLPLAVTWDNVDSTAEVGEPANNGRTIWFKWQNKEKTSPQGSPWKADFVSVSVTFGTRWRDGQSVPTDIPTVVTAYRAINEPPSGFGDLQFLARSDSGWGWSQQSQVTVDAQAGIAGAGDWIYIRVDGGLLPGGAGTAEGVGTLWAERWFETTPFNCQSCAPSNDAVDGVCLLTWQPSVFSSGTRIYDAGSTYAPAGTYIMRCCNGAWSFDSMVNAGIPSEAEQPHWVVSAIPPGSDQNWDTVGTRAGPIYPGYFFGWSFTHAGNQPWVGHLNDNLTSFTGTTFGPPIAGTNVPVGDLFGYWTPLQANGGGVCRNSIFQHDGASKIVMGFTDQAFDDNSLWNGTGSQPVYSLSVIQPDLTPLTTCASKVSTNVYDVTFTVRNNSIYGWDAVTADCLLTGGVTASVPTTGLTIGASGTTNITVQITVDPTFNKNVNAHLHLTSPYGLDVVLVYNLYPIVKINTVHVAIPFCSGYQKRVFYDAFIHGLPADNLVATVSSPDVANFADFNTCTPLNSETLGAVGGCATFTVFSTLTGPGQVQLVNPLGTTADMTIAWTDGALTYASSFVHVTGL